MIRSLFLRQLKQVVTSWAVQSSRNFSAHSPGGARSAIRCRQGHAPPRPVGEEPSRRSQPPRRPQMRLGLVAASSHGLLSASSPSVRVCPSLRLNFPFV